MRKPGLFQPTSSMPRSSITARTMFGAAAAAAASSSAAKGRRASSKRGSIGEGLQRKGPAQLCVQGRTSTEWFTHWRVAGVALPSSMPADPGAPRWIRPWRKPPWPAPDDQAEWHSTPRTGTSSARPPTADVQVGRARATSQTARGYARGARWGPQVAPTQRDIFLVPPPTAARARQALRDSSTTCRTVGAEMLVHARAPAGDVVAAPRRDDARARGPARRAARTAGGCGPPARALVAIVFLALLRPASAFQPSSKDRAPDRGGRVVCRHEPWELRRRAHLELGHGPHHGHVEPVQ